MIAPTPAAPLPPVPRRHLAAVIGVLWAEESRLSERLTAMSCEVSEPHARARLMLQAAFCRAHASRLLARKAASAPVTLSRPGGRHEPEPS